MGAPFIPKSFSCRFRLEAKSCFGGEIWKRLFISLLFVVWFAKPGLSQPLQVEQEIEPGIVVVQFEQGTYLGKVAYPPVLQVQSVEPAFPFLGMLTGKRAQLTSIQELERVHRVRYDADISPYDAARIIEAYPGVVYAEPQYRHSVSKQAPLTPNDPLFENEGYMQLMEMTKAWDVVKGEDGEVVIAIVDSGTDWEHPDLRSNLWENPGEIADNGIDDDGNGFIDDLHGWSFSDDTNDSRPLEGNAHGTAVAGAAVAVADNDVGLAGTSWNAMFIPVDVACGPNTNWMCSTNAGVLYAAMNGADIINASYGGLNFGPLRTDDLTMQAALQLGSLVVAAAMNNGVKMGGYNPRSYPASFQETLSACGTESQSYQNVWNYGYGVDVCAAGVGVTTTDLNSGYGSWSGTSFAAPLVSGIAALVKTRFPEFTPVQIREQIRTTADKKIYQAHPPSFEGLLGRGYANAYRAVTEADKVSIRMVEWEVSGRETDSCYRRSEQVNITATFESFLSDAENVTVEFLAKSPHVVFPRGNSFSIGSLQSGAQTSIDFSVTTTPSFPYRSFLFIEPRIRIADGTIVSGSDAIELYVDAVELALHETDTFSYTMTSEGNIGYADTGWIWAHWQCEETFGQIDLKGEGLMDEAGLLVGIDPARVASSVLSRSECLFNICPQSQDFVPVAPMHFLRDGSGDQVSRVTMTNTTNKLPPGLEIIQESLVNARNEFEDGALFRYRLHNQTGTAIKGVHVGLFFDPFGNDKYGMASFLDGTLDRFFPYARLDQDYTSIDGYVGFAVLSEKAPIHYRTYSSNEAADLNRPTDAWVGLTGGIVRPSGPGNEDGDAQLIGSGPYSIDAYSEVVVDFAMIYGRNQNDLVQNAQRMLQLRNDRWIDVAAISAPTRLSVLEGDSTTFGVRLAGAPSGDVTMVVSGYEGTDIKPDRQMLTFREDEWSITQSVTLNAAEDIDIDNEKITLRFSASGGGYESVEHMVDVTIVDNGVGAVAAPESVIVEEGEIESFEIALKTLPQDLVTVKLTGYENTDLTPDPTNFTFNTTDWHLPKMVKLTALDDDDLLDDEIQLTVNLSGGGYSTSYVVMVTITDNDEAMISAPASIVIPEGGTELFDVVLATAPSNYVTMSISGYEGTDLVPAPSALAFRIDNWSVPQTIALDTKEDDDPSNDEVMLTLSASGGGYDSVHHEVTVTITDNDHAMISAPTEISIVEGGMESFEIALKTTPSNEVTMTLSGYENTDLTPSPTSLTFGVDDWSIAQTVTLNTVEDKDLINDEVTLTITGSGGGYDSVTQEIKITITDNLGVNIEESDPPVSVALWGNYPNPFSEVTKIDFDLPMPAQISVIVTDILGRTVKRLPYGKYGIGRGHSLEIRAGNLTSGVYYYTLRVDMNGKSVDRSRAMTIVR